MTPSDPGNILNRTFFIFLFSVACLASEIILTRIFSVIFWYHFAFLVLSTSMLGFGIGGFLVRSHGPKLKKYTDGGVLGTGSLVAGLSLFLALILITHSPFHISDPMTSPNTIALGMGFEILAAALLMLIPFIFMGGMIVYMLQREKKQVGLIYGANLGGSAFGCLVALFLMDMAGGVNALVLVASCLVFSGVLISWKEKKPAVFCAVTGLLIVLSLFFQDRLFPIRSPLGKPAAGLEETQKVLSEWTSLSRVDIYKEKNWKEQEFGLWGLSPVSRSLLPERLGVLIDYWAYTTILKHSERPGYYDFLQDLPMYAMYRIAPPNPRMMIIGSGGGMDIRAGLHFGASGIDAVEINPAIFKAMTGELESYSGGVYTDPKVRAHLGDGRNVLVSSKDHYDIVQLSGVDTFSATQAGAYALTENYLYTMEAFQEYLERLAPEGLLSLTHWYLPSATGYPRFSLRLFCLAWSALKAQGVEHPEKHLFFFHSKRFAVLFVKKTPLSATEINVLMDLCMEKQYVCLFRPDRVIYSSMTFYSFVKAPDKKAWYDDYPFNVTPPTDNSPFYFENRKFKNILSPGNYIEGYTRFDGQTILTCLFIELLIAASILLISAIRLERKKKDLGGWMYFFFIGMGFMLVEVSFTQQLVLFLGHPVYALSVVLFSMLLFSGLGSSMAGSVSARFSMPLVVIVLAAFLAFQAFFGIPLIRNWTDSGSFLTRTTIVLLFLAPVSFLMGTAFPEAAKRLFDTGRDESLGVYWAFNSFASVMGAALAVILAILSGFTVVMICACACYVLAALLFPGSSNAPLAD